MLNNCIIIKKYKDCANRCFYAMMFSLKALLEDRGLLADWENDKLKEVETHKQLDAKLQDLVSNNILSAQYQSDFNDVKDARWACDYSLTVFLEPDARASLGNMKSFYNEVERLTTH